MGKEIEKIAIARGHEIVLKVDVSNALSYSTDDLRKSDVAIEFSTPESAVNNIYKCFDAGIPVVAGTTGWLSRLDEVKNSLSEKSGGLFYASNYSIGVNLFFKLNEYLARMMNSYPEYNASMEEIHHVHKLDAPSGTAISLAIQMIDNLERKDKWVNESSSKANELPIISKRIDEVPGTHTVTYSSEVDEISITHIAHSRKGFALGAVLAAEFMAGKKGLFGMKELMDAQKL
jgi:4-hydroxy-tetrahydrodipicolinate reductase